MIITTENTNLKANLEIIDEGVLKQVISINSNLVKDGNNFNLNFTILDNNTLETNKEAVQIEMDKFKLALNEKMFDRISSHNINHVIFHNIDIL